MTNTRAPPVKKQCPPPPPLRRLYGQTTHHSPAQDTRRRSSARWFLPIPAYISIPQPQLVPNISLPPGFDKDQETDSCKHTASKKQYAAAAAAAVSTATTRGQTHIISHLSKAAAVRPGSTTTALAPRSLPRFASLDRRLHALLGEVSHLLASGPTSQRPHRSCAVCSRLSSRSPSHELPAHHDPTHSSRL